MSLQPFNLNNAASYTFGNVTVTGNVVSGNANLGNLVTANYFSGNGSLLSSILGSSVSGQVANATVAGTVYTNAQPNITSVGTLTTLDVTGNVSANYFIGNGALLTGLPSGYSNADVANYLPTYTGNLLAGNANLGNAVVANYFVGNGVFLTGISASSSNTANTANTAETSNTANTVLSNAQPNITSVGTLVDLAVAGNALINGNLVVNGNVTYINVENIDVEDPILSIGTGPNGDPLTTNDGKDRGLLLNYYTTTNLDAFIGWDSSNSEFAFGSNVSVSNEVVTFNELGNVRAGYFIGNGSLLTGLPSGYSNADVANYLPTYTGNFSANNANVGNLTANSISTTGSGGNLTGVNYVIANYFSGNGSLLSDIAGGNVTGQVGNSLIAGTVYTNAQPNITSVGTLTSLTSNGTVDFTNSSNVTLGAVGNVKITGGTNGQYLATDGTGNLSWSTLSVTSSSISNGNSNVNIPATNGNVNISAVGNANVVVVTGTGVNIAGYLNATGNLTVSTISTGGSGGNISGANYIFANYFTGNGAALTSITGANVTGEVSYAAVANSVAVANVSGIGNIATVNLNGNGSQVLAGNGAWIASANANYANYAGEAYSVSGSNVSGQVGNALVAGTVYTNAQPNITSVGTLTTLTVNGNTNLGNVGNVKITGGSNGYVLQTDGTGNLSWVAQSGGGGGSANIAIYNEGSLLTNTVSSLDFVGAGVTATANGNAITVTIEGSNSVIVLDSFTGNGVETEYTLTTTPTSIDYTLVNIDGVSQLHDAYTLAGSLVTFDSAPANGAIIEVMTFNLGGGGGGGGGGSSGDFVTRTYTGNGVQTTFTVTSGVTVDSILVTENGILQLPTTDYTVSGANVTFTTAPANGISIQIRELASGGGTSLPTGGSNGQVLTTNGSGNLSWTTVSTGPSGGIFYENDLTLSANYTISAGKSAMSTGPITISDGVSVTIPAGSKWVIL